tara:strand:+ start:3302 stop:3952 length:651 start_codon:yes stop_codon:yes gene_type:complete
MKHVETNFLIYDLAKKGNSKAKLSAFKFIAGIIALSGLFIVLSLLNADLRFNLQEMLKSPIFSVFYMQMIIFAVNATLGSYLLYKQAIPGQTESPVYKIAGFVFCLLWATLFLVMGIYAYQEYAAGSRDMIYWDCINRALISLTFPLAVVFYFVKKGFVLNKVKTLITVCFTAFAFASFINLFVCPDNEALHIFCSHNLVIFPVIAILISFMAFKK